MTELSRIRNLSIIAHIDHGKSTLADRILEITGAVDARDMRAQYLDSMDLERERGITIKLQSVRLDYKDHVIHLIDTPGHVDFGYEVSRSLAACEGVILVVDASQGIEAQTLANCYLALENDLEIVACLNKIDLPAAEPDLYAAEIEQILGIPADDILRISAKTGEGVAELLDAVVERIPAPTGEIDEPLQALIFDSHFDSYRGVVSSVRVMNGQLRTGSKLKFMQAGVTHEAIEVGGRRPENTPVPALGPGEVGYLIAGIKDVGEARSGETITEAARPAAEPLDGYMEPKPMVFCGLFPVDGGTRSTTSATPSRSCGSTTARSPTSPRCRARSASASGSVTSACCTWRSCASASSGSSTSNLIATAPSVEYRLVKKDGTEVVVDNPADVPPPSEFKQILEPYFACSIITPSELRRHPHGPLPERRGEMMKMDYLSPERVELQYGIPLAEVVIDFFDQMKSRTQGYASLDYEPDGYDASQLVKVDVLLHGEPVDAFCTIVHKANAYGYGERMAEKLREMIPRQQFDVPIQAAIGGRIIARQTVKAYRKDVTAKLYGGDITRKKKLLEQAEGRQEADEEHRPGRAALRRLHHRPAPRRVVTSVEVGRLIDRPSTRSRRRFA
ncbi:MAG: GTP-binding protein, partial [Microthrixaceae bacterium]